MHTIKFKLLNSNINLRIIKYLRIINLRIIKRRIIKYKLRIG